MMLIRLVYVSTAVEEFTAESLRELVDHAVSKNNGLDVTGALLYSGGSFLQVLEGPEKTVLDLYQRIEQDSRHMWVECMQQSPIESRMFSDWAMNLSNFDDESSVDLRAVRLVREVLDHCQVDPDRHTRGLVFFFKQCADRVAA